MAASNRSMGRARGSSERRAAVHQSCRSSSTPRSARRRRATAHRSRTARAEATLSPRDYLASLRATILNRIGGICLAEAVAECTWTIHFSGPVAYQWRGPYPGRRIAVLFNAERRFWITGFQAEAGDAYVERQSGFWAYRPR